MSSRLRSVCLFSHVSGCVVWKRVFTMLLLARQDGTLGRHRQDGEFGVARVIPRRHGWPRWLVEMAGRSLRRHGSGLCSAVELNGRRGV